MGALGEGIGPDTDYTTRLCAALGLNPDETTEIRVELVAGVGAVVRWEGVRKVPLGQIADVLADALDPGTRPDGPSWKPGEDPWGKAPEPPC